MALSLVVEGLKMDLLMDLGRWPRAELETLVRVPENEITSYNIATNGWAGPYSPFSYIKAPSILPFWTGKWTNRQKKQLK